MTDTGRGTFTLSGQLIIDSDALAQLDPASDETAIEVPKFTREFYGAATGR